MNILTGVIPADSGTIRFLGKDYPTPTIQQMEAAGIAFAQSEDAEVVVYNATEIEDCETTDVWGDGPDGYEYAEQNDMRRLFPVWGCETLYVKRKTD